MEDKRLILEVKDIVKKYGEVTALNRVSIKIRSGEIQGLIGENGSGKSTVSSIISGIIQADSGEMYHRGKRYSPKSPLHARENNISMIVQEKDTIDMLTVGENIFLGQESHFGKFGFVNTSVMMEEARKALDLVGLTHIDEGAASYTLNFETRKMVEIAKALYYEPDLLIVDETTTALSQDGREKIHKIMRQFRNEGKAVLFISHDLQELMEVCDNLTVLRDGTIVDTIEQAQFNENAIKKSMVGRTLSDQLYRMDYESRITNNVAVYVESITSENLDQVTLSLYEGEILGIGGLSGSGLHELGQVMAGHRKVTKGKVMVYGKELKNVSHAMELKVGYISKNRDSETLILNETIEDNLSISAWRILKKWRYFILPWREKAFAKNQIKLLNIKCSSRKQLVRELSGGNKQKVSFGKIIGNNSKILILDSPTRGVDIGVKTTMYQLINDLKKQGYAILIITEELTELLGMSDRILVFKNGRISKEFLRAEELRDTDVIEYMI